MVFSNREMVEMKGTGRRDIYFDRKVTLGERNAEAQEAQRIVARGLLAKAQWCLKIFLIPFSGYW